MKTIKMSAKQIKEQGQFKAISNTGKVAEFKVDGAVAVATFEDGTTKEMKVDSIRRSWEVVVEEVQTEAPAEEVAQVEEQVVAEEVAEEVQSTIEVGQTVKLVDGTLATVETSDDEIPAELEALEVVEAPAEEKKAPAKRQSVGKNTKASQYEKMIEELEPTSVEEKQGCVKMTFETDDITLEYYKGEINWLAMGDHGDEMLTEWELLRSKKKGSWHGVFLKENHEVVITACTITYYVVI